MVTTRPVGQSYIIKRPRLTKLLDESQARIILLCAPAGYGKTTLAREWVATRSEPVAWYRGGPEMLDVAAVAQSLSAVLPTAGVGDGAASRVVAIASQTSDPDVLARALVASMSDAPGTLVIDDYQHAAGTHTERLLGHVVTNTQMRVLLTSRVRPVWLTPRMCIYGDACIVGSDELAFTDDEARAVLRHDCTHPQTDFVSQTGGWPAVIGLAARRADAITATPGQLPTELYNYIAQDLFAEAPAALRAALFRLALVGDSDTALIYDLLGRQAASLSDAVTSGFIARATDGAIELHPLLRTFLLARVHELPGTEQETLVQAVIPTLKRMRKWDEILSLLTEFRFPELAGALLESAFPELVENGRLSTIRRWLKLVPAAASNPMLLLARAEVALREGANAEAQALAERATELSLVDELTARAHLAAARAAHLAGDDLAARRNAARARSTPAPPDVHVAAQWLEFLQAFESQDGQAARVLDDLRKVDDMRPEHAMRLRQSQAFLDLETRGDVEGAVRQLELARPLLADVSDPIGRSSFLNLFSSACLYAGLYTRAMELAEMQIEEAVSAGLSFAADHGMTTRAAALLGARQIGEARKILQSLQRSATASSFVTSQVVLRLSRLRATIGDLPGACELVDPPPPPGIPLAMRGEWLATRGLYEAALGRLESSEQSIQAALAASRYIDTIHLARLTTAVTALQTLSPTSAETVTVTVFRELISRAHADAVVVGCRVFPRLASVASADNDTRPALVNILAASNDVDIARASGLHIPRNKRAHRQLSHRELEVSELMAQGLTNREIAKALFISESTAKVHVKHILEKLGVRSRTEAVRALLEAD